MRIEIRKLKRTDDGYYGEFQKCGTCEQDIGCSIDGAYVIGVGLGVLCVGCAIKKLAGEKEELSLEMFYLNSEHTTHTLKEYLLDRIGDSISGWARKECLHSTASYPKTVNKIHAEFTQKYAKQIEQLGLPSDLIEGP